MPLLILSGKRGIRKMRSITRHSEAAETPPTAGVRRPCLLKKKVGASYWRAYLLF